MRPVVVLRCPLVLFACVVASTAAWTQTPSLDVPQRAENIHSKVVAWRRDLHAHPELSNRETRTAAVVAKHLRSLGMEVRTGVAHTGVVAVLRGGRSGPIVALRADMDALPVTEQTDVPFRSKVTAEYRGETVGVMHACGHDAHVAMLMGVAEVLAGVREQLGGTVLFVFQPAEEGAPEGERGGAKLMIEEGAFDIGRPSAIFGLHVIASLPTGVIGYRSGPMMAGSDSFTIDVQGRQTHGSRPWGGIDPVLAAAHIITNLQSIVSRQVDITATPVVLSVGAIKGGIRFNIIPDSVQMIGTLRTFTAQVREDVVGRMQNTVTSVAAASGASATLRFNPERSIPAVINDRALTERMLPVLRSVAGESNVREITLQTTAEDFSYYGTQGPALFLWIGATPPDRDPITAPFNHSPLFYLDEDAMRLGVKTLLSLALAQLEAR